MVLEDIVARQRQALAATRGSRDIEALFASAEARGQSRSLVDAILGGPRPGLIAECKRRSPVKGVLREEYDPVAQAKAYVAGGASAISVLTSPDFDGTLDHLEAVASSVHLPVLRKDFILETEQVLEARAAGADAILLIVRIVEQAELEALAEFAREHMQMEILVEIHDEAELDRALEVEPELIGVNQRNLATFDVDSSLFGRVAPRLPEDVFMVAESGFTERTQVEAAAAAGARAVLVGETLMRADDPAAKVRELLGSP